MTSVTKTLNTVHGKRDRLPHDPRHPLGESRVQRVMPTVLPALLS